MYFYYIMWISITPYTTTQPLFQHHRQWLITCSDWIFSPRIFWSHSNWDRWCYNRALKHSMPFCHTYELWARCSDRVAFFFFFNEAFPRNLFHAMLQVLLYTTVWQAALKKSFNIFTQFNFSCSCNAQPTCYNQQLQSWD